MTDIGAMFVVWWVFGTIIAMALAVKEVYPGKRGTWGELVLATLFWPSWITLVVMIGIAVGAEAVWEFLDKPIRRDRQEKK